MRNILMTVMMLLVVILLFNSIVAGSDGSGLRGKIQEQGNTAVSRIGDLSP